MTIYDSHYEVKLGLDKLDTLDKKNLHDAEIDWLLNKAHVRVTKRKYSEAEVVQKRIEDLDMLKVNFANQPAINATVVPNSGAVIYESDLSDLEYRLLFPLNGQVTITKTDCPDKTVDFDLTQSDDFTDALSNTNYSPSYNWGVVLAEYSKDSTGNNQGSLFTYTDGTFAVSELFLNYYKYPRKVWIGTYDLTDDLKPKTASNNYYVEEGVTYQASSGNVVHSELSEEVQLEIVNEAITLAATNIEDPEYVGSKGSILQTQE